MRGHVSRARPSCQRAEGALALHIPLPPDSRGCSPINQPFPDARSGPGMPEHPQRAGDGSASLIFLLGWAGGGSAVSNLLYSNRKMRVVE